MSHPIIADNRTAKVELQKGKQYYFCRCGRSQQQPFCDGTYNQFGDAQVGREGPGPK